MLLPTVTCRISESDLKSHIRYHETLTL